MAPWHGWAGWFRQCSKGVWTFRQKLMFCTIKCQHCSEQYIFFCSAHNILSTHNMIPLEFCFACIRHCTQEEWSARGVQKRTECQDRFKYLSWARWGREVQRLILLVAGSWRDSTTVLSPCVRGRSRKCKPGAATVRHRFGSSLHTLYQHEYKIS